MSTTTTQAPSVSTTATLNGVQQSLTSGQVSALLKSLNYTGGDACVSFEINGGHFVTTTSKGTVNVSMNDLIQAILERHEFNSPALNQICKRTAEICNERQGGAVVSKEVKEVKSKFWLGRIAIAAPVKISKLLKFKSCEGSIQG